jgi:hypothetical protein
MPGMGLTRRTLLGGLVGALGLGGAGADAQSPPRSPPDFPPVPSWRPSFQQPLADIVARLHYYADNSRDFVTFGNGTCVFLAPDTPDQAACAFALQTLAAIFNVHPDMNPARMDDGNLMVRYNHPAVNVVLSAVARAHWAEIEARHLDGLTRDEVLITPLGPNRFDDAGKMALLGRAYFFMDAQDPQIAGIERARA